MLRRLHLIPLLLGACYGVPEDLPPYDGVPRQATGVCAPDREERVLCVLDGDTFDVDACGEAGERVRLNGIDAPEIAHQDSPADCFGPEAEARLRDLLLGARVLLSFDTQCTDTFERTLAWVMLPDPDDEEAEPLNVNVWMVQEGLARLYDEREDFDTLRHAPALRDALVSAQAREVGLWGACAE